VGYPAAYAEWGGLLLLRHGDDQYGARRIPPLSFAPIIQFLENYYSCGGNAPGLPLLLGGGAAAAASRNQVKKAKNQMTFTEAKWSSNIERCAAD